jgi:hypothetical protein
MKCYPSAHISCFISVTHQAAPCENVSGIGNAVSPVVLGVVMEVSGRLHAPTALHPRNDPTLCLMDRRLIGLNGLSRRSEGKFFVPVHDVTPVYRWSSPQPAQLTKIHVLTNNKQQTPWSESASELYRPSDRRLSAK